MKRRALLVGAPIVAVATLMVGLRIGAGDRVVTAEVWTGPPGHATATGVPYAFQVVTYLEDQGVRETVALPELEVVARTPAGHAVWRGGSNADGIAEANVVLPREAEIDLVVRVPGAGMPLAEGRFRADARPLELVEARARPSQREGAPIDVLVEGGRLVVGFPTPLWARVGAAKTLDVAPEPGLRLEGPAPRLGLPGCEGIAALTATAEAHVLGLGLTTHEPEGRWFGALPVAPGSFFATLPRAIPAGRETEVVLVAPNPRTVVYAEVDDALGRVTAAALDVRVEPGDPTPRARLRLPPLAAGPHWLVVSGEPRGAERLEGATLAHPFLVGHVDGVREDEPCSVGPWLAAHAPTGFPRQRVLDGMATRGATNRARHRLGLALGLGALAVAALLETLLLLGAAREARATLASALDEAGAPPEKPGGNVTIALLVALLGFAFLAALLIAKA